MHREGQAPSGCLMRKGAVAWTTWAARIRPRGLGLFLNHTFKLLLNGMGMFPHFNYWS